MSKIATYTRREALRPEELASLRGSLLAERQRMLAQYQEDVHAAWEIREEGVEDLEELATMDVDRELLYAMSDAELDKLHQIDEALNRMEEGRYGLCLYSGEPIPLDRLREVPWARYSVEVQGLVEDGLIDVGRPATVS